MSVLQGRCVVLTALEQPNDRDLSWVLVHRLRDDRAAAVMADTQTGPDVFTRCAAVRKQRQTLASGDDGVGEALRSGCGCRRGHVEEQRLELAGSLGCEDHPVGHHTQVPER